MDIGDLQKLDEEAVRRIWPSETRDFSPWLFENISHLNDILNIRIEIEELEGSRPAPHFRLVAGPPPRKRREITPTDQITPRNRQYQDFFDSLRGKILELQPNFTKAKGLPQNWWTLGVGRTDFSLVAALYPVADSLT